MVQGNYGNSVKGNEFIKNSNGIRINESQDSLVQGNTFSGTSGNVFAIFLDNVLSSTIANNTFPNRYDGITMSESRNNELQKYQRAAVISKRVVELESGVSEPLLTHIQLKDNGLYDTYSVAVYEYENNLLEYNITLTPPTS